MTIRELHDSDDAEYRQLLKYAFDWSMDDDEEKANIMEFQHASAWGIGEPLVSALTAIHLDVRMGETTFKMAGVSDVASYPEASGQGNIELLMRRALDTLVDQGFTLAYLMPFSAPFYRRFGFEDAITETTNEVKTARLPKVKMPEGVEVRRESWATAIPALKTVYDRNSATRRGGLVRQEWWWQLRPLRDTGLQAAVAYRDGNASGYLIYKRADDEFSVDECFYDDAETAQALVAFAFAHRNTVKTYIYRTPDAGWLGDLLPEPGALTSTTRAFGMVRVLNVQDFLQRYPYTTNDLGPIVIGLSDEFMPVNSGSWRLAIEGGRVFVERTDAEPQVQIAGQQLVKGSFGVRSFEKLAWLGQVHGDPQKITELSRAFTSRQTLFFDYI